MGDLDSLREKIDRIDKKILRLLKKRVSIAKQIGYIKKERGLPILDEERETKVFSNISKQAEELGLSDQDAQAIYKEIIGMCLRAQGQELKVAFLGPYGTFTEEASKMFFTTSGTRFIACPSIFDVFRSVDGGNVTYGVVPVENSTEGSVNLTLDLLFTSDLMIYGEIELQIKHNLIIPPTLNLEDIKVILSHPQALSQCRNYLRDHFPDVELRDVSSTAKAVRMLKNTPNAAAIGTELAAKRYGMKIAARGIQDSSRNYTRFFVLAKNDHPPTGLDKTSIIFSVENLPGALYRALSTFAERNINITKIESRPTKTKTWQYIFFLDFEGHRRDGRYIEALKELEHKTIFLKNLGSYPVWNTKGVSNKNQSCRGINRI